MKKVLLVVAMLLLATPIFAASDVTITATQLLPAPDSPLQQVTIAYTGAAEANSIRAFALSLTTDLDSNAVMSNIRGFKRGESKTGNLGYGIFPARFRQYITPLNGTDVNSTGGYGWQDGNYTPLAIWGDVNAGWGENTKWIVTELGTLYQGEANAPGTSGTLFVIDVNNPDKKDCNLCIALDQIRGGVVKNNTTSATVTLPPGGSGAPAGCIRVVYAASTYTISGRVYGAAAPRNTGLGGVTIAGLPGSPITASDGSYTATVSGGWSGTATPTDPNGQWNFAAPGPASRTYTNVSANMTAQDFNGTALECLNKRDVGYANWVTLGKRDCWCYKKQCRGDTDNKATLSKYVVAADLTTFLGAYNKTVTTLVGLMPTQPNLICADSDHKATLSKPVVAADLTTFLAWYNKTGVTDCAATTINAWKP